MIKIIAAAADNNALGLNQNLPWHLPDDFKRFKALTVGHHIIMGRKTFESFTKPLPNRVHIVMTRQKDFQKTGCIVVSSLDEALQCVPEGEDVYVIGGGEIYKQSIDIADVIELTRVHCEFKFDACFPKIDMNVWFLKEEEFHAKDERHQYDFTFQTFIKK